MRADLTARKQLQRDLHDGVQQQVVAMIAHLGALKVLLPIGSRAAAVATTTLDQARSALVELPNVVDGVQPPVLLDQGLVSAVRSRAALLPLSVCVSGPSHDRWSPEVEAAAYYVVSEALTNVVKHSGASRAEVSVARQDHDLVVTVEDDGTGVPDGVDGSGLVGMHDRVETLGGTLTLDTSERGTTVTARLRVTGANGG